MNKMDEIVNIRNSLAHFRPIKVDDIELVKQNAKHVFAIIEEIINNLIKINKIVPTNTDKDWYTELRTLGGEDCSIKLFQSKNEQWVMMELEYKCAVINKSMILDNYIIYDVLTLLTPSILKKYESLSNLLIYISESVPYIKMDDLPNFKKNVRMVFSQETLSENFSIIKTQLEELLLTVSREIDLIKQDNLAKGDLVEVTQLTASLRGDKNQEWQLSTYPLYCIDLSGDPPEYWGNIDFFTSNYFTSTHKYPWSSVDISKISWGF